MASTRRSAPRRVLSAGVASKSSRPKKGGLVSELPTLEWETRYGYPNQRVAGVDEVGRGCLAGPVVAAAVILPPTIDRDRNPWINLITDSKALSAETREELFARIQPWVLAWGIASATAAEIDRINIFHASHLAMERAVAGLSRTSHQNSSHPILPHHILVDGKFLPKVLPCPATAIIKGDLKSLSIAAASILAKVWRDRYMAELESVFPGYGFAVHKGYPTPAHRAALQEKGICVEHRRSFGPVSAIAGRDRN